jgi:hypothetical protein
MYLCIIIVLLLLLLLLWYCSGTLHKANKNFSKLTQCRKSYTWYFNEKSIEIRVLHNSRGKSVNIFLKIGI